MGYTSSNDFGLLKFLEWCQDLRTQPVLAVHAGYPLHGEHVAPGPALQSFVDDVLDEIEDITGDALTKWGGQRERQRDLNDNALNLDEPKRLRFCF